MSTWAMDNDAMACSLVQKITRVLLGNSALLMVYLPLAYNCVLEPHFVFVCF